jgi:XTP/dITP diphosphohydrolase
VGVAPGRLVLLATSPRVAPDLLSALAWTALRGADSVVTVEADHPLVDVLAAAGIDVVVAGDVDDVVTRAGRASVVHLLAAHDDPRAVESRAIAAGVDVAVVQGSWDLPGAHLLDLVAVMDRLRSPGGCPWDAEQTHTSLVEYLVEEAYETVEAIESGDDDELRAELGDLLLQVAFHARIAEEHDVPWDIDDVADGITAKLVSRHPHVFAEDDARTPDEVESNWKRLKAAEKGRASVTDGIPSALPALVLAAKLLRRAADLDVAPVPASVASVADRAIDEVAGDETEGAAGDLLLALVARLRDAGLDPEHELRAAVRRYRAAVRAAEGVED